MTTGPGEHLVPNLPGDTLATAIAIADRWAADQAVMSRIGAQVRGEEYTGRSQEETREAHFGRAALMLLHVEDPTRLLTVSDLREASAGGEVGYELRAAEMRERGIDVESDHLRYLDHLLVQALEAGDERETGGDVSEEFARELAASQAVAEANGVDVATVYARDNLYYEALSTAFPPIETAEKIHQAVDAISEFLVAKMMVINTLPSSLRSSIDDQTLTQMTAVVQLDASMQRRIVVQTNLEKEVARQKLLYFFLRTYGYGVFSSLPEDLRSSLQPTHPLAEELAALMPANPAEG